MLINNILDQVTNTMHSCSRSSQLIQHLIFQLWWWRSSGLSSHCV